MHFLIAAKDYWGTATAVHTANMYKELAQSMGANTKTLLGNELTASAFVAEYKAALQALEEPNSRVIAVTIGHGNQFADKNGDEEDGRDEGWQLPDGTILDDTFTELASSVQCHDTALLVLVSDHCSSGTMIDPRCTGNWVNIASSQPWQDSLASGDGNVMSCCLLEYLKGKNPTVVELAKDFPGFMASSWVGDLQTPLVSFGGKAAGMQVFA